ncbi:hypothetical protein [Burkholderia cenocepacia]|uniref:hypothetical protein n=1 Tax=Burkholderia cenocepacia TaxID=95486 RepID=UPI002ABD9BD8|nr:hypothetical protein [Burkholderia cenocepacia]
MHPKAATLALAGYTLVLYMFGPDDPSNTVRAVHMGRSEYGITLAHYMLAKEGDRWDLTHAGQPPESYVPVPWDRLPDEEWDALPNVLLNRAIQGD